MKKGKTIFSIRDDDTSFFTDPIILEKIYSKIWPVVPISLSVIPYAIENYKSRKNSYFLEEYPIGRNKELVDWLKEKIKNDNIEIMLHGYNHQYKKLYGNFFGEYFWKKEKELINKTKLGKKYLEDLLETRIKIFVPPSNTIGRSGVKAIRNSDLYLNGILGKGLDRPISKEYIVSYIKRWLWRINYKEAYPFVIEYDRTKELRHYTLSPQVKLNNILNSLKRNIYLNAPFILATHYWELNDNPEMLYTLQKIIAFIKKANVKTGKVSNCFETI